MTLLITGAAIGYIMAQKEIRIDITSIQQFMEGKPWEK
jgi:hypothetical protein